jgi:hypothetical protein
MKPPHNGEKKMTTVANISVVLLTSLLVFGSVIQLA